MTGVYTVTAPVPDREGRTVFFYAHPLFWAPFSLIGDGGGGTPRG